MSDTGNTNWCDLPVPVLTFNIEEDFISSFPALDLALRAVNKVLLNTYLIRNFAPHFIPYNDYEWRMPVSADIQQNKVLFV
jgi:hypothetical protein